MYYMSSDYTHTTQLVASPLTEHAMCRNFLGDCIFWLSASHNWI